VARDLAASVFETADPTAIVERSGRDAAAERCFRDSLAQHGFISGTTLAQTPGLQNTLSIIYAARLNWHRRLAVGGPRSGVAPGRPRAEPTGLNPTTGKMTGAPTGKAPDTVLLALRDPTGAVKRRPGERRLQCDDNTNHGRQYRVAVKVWTALALDPRGHLRAPLREHAIVRESCRLRK